MALFTRELGLVHCLCQAYGCCIGALVKLYVWGHTRTSTRTITTGLVRGPSISDNTHEYDIIRMKNHRIIPNLRGSRRFLQYNRGWTRLPWRFAMCLIVRVVQWYKATRTARLLRGLKDQYGKGNSTADLTRSCNVV